MATEYKVVFDCADPHRLAAFWAVALGYVVEDHSMFIRELLDGGIVSDQDVRTVNGRLAWRDAAGIRDPDAPVDARTGVGQRGRVLFQVVPEAKTVKNRVHLDLHVGPDRVDTVVAQLVGLGARALWDGQQGPTTWKTLADPEGNEFCVS
jgi:hypothetical protein